MADCEFDPVTAAKTQGEDMVRPGKTRHLTATFVTQGKERQTTRIKSGRHRDTDAEH
jgi:hypothetical protein